MDYSEESWRAIAEFETGGQVSAEDWFKGIALSVLASLVGGASKLAIRKSWLIQHEHEESSSDDDSSENDMPRPLTLDTGDDESISNERQFPSWFPYCLRYCGMFGMSVLNPVCCVLAMNYASPSILAPFSGLTLVGVILFSQAIVGEKPTNPQITAALLIIAGEVIVALFGDHTNDEGVTIDDVVSFYYQKLMIVVFSIS